MANWLRVKRDGKKVRFPRGGGFDLYTEDDARVTEYMCQRYGVDTALGGAFWGSILTIAVLKAHEWLKKRKMKKEKTEEDEENEVQEPDEE